MGPTVGLVQQGGSSFEGQSAARTYSLELQHLLSHADTPHSLACTAEVLTNEPAWPLMTQWRDQVGACMGCSPQGSTVRSAARMAMRVVTRWAARINFCLAPPAERDERSLALFVRFPPVAGLQLQRSARHFLVP